MTSILVLFGGWPGHKPQQFAEAFVTRYGGEYKITTSDDLNILNSEQLSNFDLLVPIWTQGSLTETQENSLVEAVSDGLGVLAWHGVTDAFRTNQIFKMMIGGSFICHPGDYRDYTIKMIDNSLIKVDDIDNFEIKSEQYFMHIDPTVEVIASAKFEANGSPVDNIDMPIAWAKTWGKGRIFYTAIGHELVDFEQAQAKLLLDRGLKWVLQF